jgi:caffeoyl-CoA O-methyltransferase
MDDKVFERVDHYISGLLATEDDCLLHTLKSLEENTISNASISPNQGKMLQVFARMCNAKNILELGTLGGYSTIWLARALPENGKLISIEFDKLHAAVAEKNISNAKLNDKVEIRVGKALDILPEIESEITEPFDLIFIDADKPPYVEYFEWALRLSRPGTIIISDNVIRNGNVLDKNSVDEKVKGVQRFNQYLGQCKKVTATILQTVGVKEYDGMAIAVVN